MWKQFRGLLRSVAIDGMEWATDRDASGRMQSELCRESKPASVPLIVKHFGRSRATTHVPNAYKKSNKHSLQVSDSLARDAEEAPTW
ncbi:hypothetical protein O181_018302 [Austropuccinia psidii MF-1]|uniref:Uncharacterized protein n=1 Tax=Austropuccinia psidii MF-1 TaxID=1389203 RepID=A0A9Q3GTE2_9BASI|nr:hypothetical protein [Austropuccinia psidii MF-1]